MFEIRKLGYSKVEKVCESINDARRWAERLKARYGCNMVIKDANRINNWNQLDK